MAKSVKRGEILCGASFLYFVFCIFLFKCVSGIIMGEHFFNIALIMKN
jgi:hypothetical protein